MTRATITDINALGNFDLPKQDESSKVIQMTEPNYEREMSPLETQANDQAVGRSSGLRKVNMKSIELKKQPEAFKP